MNENIVKEQPLMGVHTFNFGAALTALCLAQCVKYACSLVGAMRFTPTAADRTVFDAMREVFTQFCRRYYVSVTCRPPRRGLLFISSPRHHCSLRRAALSLFAISKNENMATAHALIE